MLFHTPSSEGRKVSVRQEEGNSVYYFGGEGRRGGEKKGRKEIRVMGKEKSSEGRGWRSEGKQEIGEGGKRGR